MAISFLKIYIFLSNLGEICKSLPLLQSFKQFKYTTLSYSLAQVSVNVVVICSWGQFKHACTSLESPSQPIRAHVTCWRCQTISM